ncbi:MAG: transcriptional regulator [Alphaproteobacteria bacterium]|nr:MAG: transcriptional regulator [Alphaproteobacteria bacterium]
MSDDIKYGQFCPVAKAAEIVSTRWTLLILREIISGSHHFNEIHRGVPLMSRALLSKRLKQLEDWNVVAKESANEAQGSAYHLTEAGMSLGPIIYSLGQWGKEWVKDALEKHEWDAGVLMWDLRRRIDSAYFTKPRTVLNFEFEDAPAEMRAWWVVVDESGVDLCQKDPGFDVDLYVSSEVQPFAEVWIGRRDLKSAIEDDIIYLSGTPDLMNTIDRWLLLALVTQEENPFELPA